MITGQNKRDVMQAVERVEREYGVKVLQVSAVGPHAMCYGRAGTEVGYEMIYVHPLDRYLNIFNVPTEKIGAYTENGQRIDGQDLRHYINKLAGSNPKALEFARNQMGMIYGSAGFTGDIEVLGQYCFNPESIMAYFNYAESKLNGDVSEAFDLSESLLGAYMNLLIAEYILNFRQMPHPEFARLAANSLFLKAHAIESTLMGIANNRRLGRNSEIPTPLFQTARVFLDELRLRAKDAKFKETQSRSTTERHARADQIFLCWVKHFDKGFNRE